MNHSKTHKIPNVPETSEVATGLHFLNTSQGFLPLTHELSASLALREKTLQRIKEGERGRETERRASAEERTY